MALRVGGRAHPLVCAYSMYSIQAWGHSVVVVVVREQTEELPHNRAACCTHHGGINGLVVVCPGQVLLHTPWRYQWASSSSSVSWSGIAVGST